MKAAAVKTSCAPEGGELMSASGWPYPSYFDRRWLGGERGSDRALAAVVTAVRATVTGGTGATPAETDGALLAGLSHLGEVAERVDWALLSLVGEARAGGASWTDVGRALGVSRQAAQQRFAPWVAEAMTRRRQNSGG
jgi:hypothetical protein